jgi:hypothetical protein
MGYFGGRDVLQDSSCAFYNQFDTFNNLVNVVRFQLARLMLWGDITSEQFTSTIRKCYRFFI